MTKRASIPNCTKCDYQLYESCVIGKDGKMYHDWCIDPDNIDNRKWEYKTPNAKFKTPVEEEEKDA